MGVCFQSITGDGPIMRKKLRDIDNGFVWVCGRRDPNPSAEGINDWHLQGIATDEKVAVEMCVDENYFVGPIPVNTALPHRRIEWVGSYFPYKRNKQLV